MIDAISIRIFSSLTHRGLLILQFHGDGQMLIFRSDTKANCMTHLIYRECARFFKLPRADDQTALCRTLPNSAGPFRALCVWWGTSECGERVGWLARTLQSAVHVWSKSAAKKASSSLILQPGLWKTMGNPHRINFRNCCDLRLWDRNECSSKAMGKTNGGSNEGGAAGDKQLAGGVAECKAAGVLQRGEARQRRAEENRAADSAEGHGFREADHRVSRRMRRCGHTVVRVPGVQSVTLRRLHLVVSKKHEKQCNWWCGACGCQHEWRHPNDRDSSNLPLCVVVVVCCFQWQFRRNVFQSIGDDDRSIREGCQTQKKSWMAGQVRMEEFLAKAVTVDGRKSDAADTFRDDTFGRGRIVAGARQIFRQCHNLCQ